MNSHLMNALAHSLAFWVALILGLLTLYILPSMIGAIRGVEGLGWIVVINLLPTGVGWPAALILALALPRRSPRHASPGLPVDLGHRWPPPSPPSPPENPAVPLGATVISGALYHVIEHRTAKQTSWARSVR